MTTTPHTPGPWKPWGITDEVATHGGSFLCTVRRRAVDPESLDKPFQEDQEASANARLIAAAPDMLAALKDALQILISRGTALGLDDKGPVLDAVRAAIAKATEPS